MAIVVECTTNSSLPPASTVPAIPKKDADAWCTAPWCWVDPCTCGLADVKTGVYFKATTVYSYSNCGGVDTWQGNQTNPNLTSSCSATSSPKSVCTPRMANSYPLITCKGGTMGQCREANVSGTMFKNYPANYGEGCGIHAEPGHSDCSNISTGTAKASQAAWCNSPFSWVNPCECQSSDMAKSTYFPGLYYSYSVCGGNDTYTTAALQASAKTALNCPSPPPPAKVQSPGNYPGSDPKDKKCACIPVTQGAPLVNCTTDYAQMGMCVNATKFPGFYPANYGTTCGVHAEPLSSSCFDTKSGRPWKSPCRGDKTEGCRASWCDSAWCFVDPCTCTGVNDIAKSSWFPDANLFYTYENCKGVDTFTNSSEASKTTFDKGAVCDTSCKDLETAYENQACCQTPDKKFDMPTGSMLKQMMPKSRRLSSAEMAEDVKMSIKEAFEQAAAHEDPGRVASLARELIGTMQGYTDNEF